MCRVETAPGTNPFGSYPREAINAFFSCFAQHAGGQFLKEAI